MAGGWLAYGAVVVADWLRLQLINAVASHTITEDALEDSCQMQTS